MKWILFLSLLCCEAVAQEAIGLKEDVLGESLEEFKQRHKRVVKGHNEPAPRCSDSQPGSEGHYPLAEDGFTELGLVNCELMFPFERYRGRQETVAGSKTEMLVYHFVDGSLYRITVRLPINAYGRLKKALLDKHLEPSSIVAATYQNGFGAKFSGDVIKWHTGSASVNLFQYAGSISSSSLIYSLGDLEEVVAKRLTPTDDDL